VKKQTLIFVSRVIRTMSTQCGYLRLVCQSAEAPENVLQELSRLQVVISEVADLIEQMGTT
jgi:hypothetical protein